MKEEVATEGESRQGLHEFQFCSADGWDTFTWEEGGEVWSWKADSSMDWRRNKGTNQRPQQTGTGPEARDNKQPGGWAGRRQ